MSQPSHAQSEASPPPESAAHGQTRSLAALEPTATRLRALRSAWSAIAACCATGPAAEVANAEAAVAERLARLARLPTSPEPESLRRLHFGLEDLAEAIRAAASGISLEALQATLPGLLAGRRSALLDLLDLLAAEACETPKPPAARLGPLDYLITLLCTEGDAPGRVAPLDPVRLTPAFEALCQKIQAECQTRLPDVEASFFSAANLAEDLKDPQQQRELRQRKARLGRSYFAPGMLRAIVTYNLALLQCLRSDAWQDQQWADAQDAPAAASDSVFASLPLRALHAAVVRRLEKQKEPPDPHSRIAAALALDALSPTEVAALRDGSLDASDLRVGIILVGLVCPALNVLAIELQEIGIDPDLLSGRWAAELDERVKREVNRSITGVAYAEACVISQLRNRFLFAPLRGVAREPGRAAPPPPAGAASEEREVRRQARRLSDEALAGTAVPRAPSLSERPPRSWRVLAPAIAAGGVGLALALQLLGAVELWPRELERWSSEELAQASGYLVGGHRNGAGAGASFVGTLDASWLGLRRDERERIARELVARLRAQGITQVMLYDADRTLRVQALGESLRTHAGDLR